MWVLTVMGRREAWGVIREDRRQGSRIGREKQVWESA